MGISNYFQHLRSLVGHELILCPGVTAVVVRDAADHREVLLVQRADNAEWTPVSGALEPGEDADVGAVREVLEETRLQVVVDRVLWIQTLPRSTYPNGDQVQYYDTAFSCRPVAGTAEVGDDESRAVGWFSEHALPPLAERFRTTIALALNPPAAPAFGADRRSPGAHP
ncbi:NUDIX hydrolase [Kribbella sp. DT2]|uniref:NUDIX hydrolase n=1 Tax=Kribbella sp. DT2 TaxID=3393427 RepID=UPI003CF096BB